MAAAQPPHIVLILSDEHRGQALGHLGDPNLRTPAMDAMAAAGSSFRRAYANCPVCTPSRGTIFSGRHAHAGPVFGFFESYLATAPSVATELRADGYRTAYFGKWHCGRVYDQQCQAIRDNPRNYGGVPNRTPEHLRAGFQDWFGFEINNKPFDGHYYHRDELEPRQLPGYQTDALTDLAIQYLGERDATQPLFMVLSVEPPHFPLDAPQRFKRWNPEMLAVRPNFADDPLNRANLALYYAMIENLDWNIGRLRNTLARTPGFEDAIVIYVSDHGDFLGSHGYRVGKSYPHEESTRVPALFCGGQLPAQGAIDGLFSLVDLTPTILGLAGHPNPAWCQGFDWSPVLRGQASDSPTEILLEMHGGPRWNFSFVEWRAVVDQRYKYAHYETGVEHLFDLVEDPYEQTNLADSQPALKATMRDRLLRLLAATREPFYDVVMQHGVPLQGPIRDASTDRTHGGQPLLALPEWARPEHDPRPPANLYPGT